MSIVANQINRMSIISSNVRETTQITKMSYALLQIMSFHLLSFLAFVLFTIFLYRLLLSTISDRKKLKTPPSPPKLPIIGNLHQLGKLPHCSLGSLSRKYGELMLLHLGNRPTLIVSSANAADIIMKSHDLSFADRPQLRFINRIFYNGNDVGFTSYGEKWRYKKSICVRKLLSNNNVRSFKHIREEEVALLIRKLKRYGGSVLNLSEIFAKLTKGLTCRTALGKTYEHGHHDESCKDIYKLLKELTEVMGMISIGDYIPYLGWIDRLNGLESRVEYVRKQFHDFIEEVVKEHEIYLDAKQECIEENDYKEHKNVKNFVENLLEIQRDNPQQLSRDDIKGVILDIFGAGTDTTSTMLEWAMTELIRHPKSMKKLQEEVRGIVKAKTRVTEDDLEKMIYLKAVIKEILRLHPPVPLSVFRESTQDVKIHEYFISARTQLIINTWEIQRDPKLWQNPKDFYPERFLNNELSVDYHGRHSQFLPFGGGRRGCPGVSLATITTEFVLASLVYEFNWTLPNGRDGQTLDVNENWGISVRRRHPLIVIATPYVPHSSCN